ncbi:MAG: signal peptide peptidase SppA [Deferribacterota bacterium]|nr:signal peptide peptidase SppA [Deferribacterota bacterium]
MRILKIILMVLLIILIADIIYIISNFGKKGIISDSIVEVKLEGVILDEDEFINTLKRYKKSDKVKGFIISIDSPGGMIGPTQKIYRFLNSLKMPVYAVMDSVAASGGYYVAAATDKIYALPGTITGSIGVILQLSNFKELLDNIGIDFISVKSGKFKDIGSPYREVSEEEVKILQDTIDNLYNQFLRDIKKGRKKIDNETLLKYADGRVFTGEKAYKLGFVDKLGTVNEAFEDMKKELDDPSLKLFTHEKPEKFIEKVLGILPFEIKNLLHPEGFYYLYNTY